MYFICRDLQKRKCLYKGAHWICPVCQTRNILQYESQAEQEFYENLYNLFLQNDNTIRKEYFVGGEHYLHFLETIKMILVGRSIRKLPHDIWEEIGWNMLKHAGM